ncbi:MAG: hypothetical protein R3C25_14405 [Hyphomonadaceae bacterium]
MRLLIAASFALAAAACGEIEQSHRDGVELAGGEGGYTLEIRAVEGAQTYIVTAPDGRVVGGRAAGGASALMDADRVRALASEPPPEGETTAPQVVSLRLPGFSMTINADQDDENGNGRVALSVGGGEGQTVVVNADEGGPGDEDDRAYVRITGVDEEAARHFIAEADELSPGVQAQMLAGLGLE